MTWIAFTVQFTCVTLLLVFALYLMIQNFFSAPYVPSNRRKVRRAFEELGIGAQTKLVDLGSGDGTIVRLASELGATASGVEINPYLTLYAKFRELFTKRKAKFYHQSMYKHDLSEYNTIYLYLLPDIMSKLLDKFTAELQPGTKIITNTFTLPEHKPEQELPGHIYVYQW